MESRSAGARPRRGSIVTCDCLRAFAGALMFSKEFRIGGPVFNRRRRTRFQPALTCNARTAAAGRFVSGASRAPGVRSISLVRGLPMRCRGDSALARAAPDTVSSSRPDLPALARRNVGEGAAFSGYDLDHPQRRRCRYHVAVHLGLGRRSGTPARRGLRRGVLAASLAPGSSTRAGDKRRSHRAAAGLPRPRCFSRNAGSAGGTTLLLLHWQQKPGVRRAEYRFARHGAARRGRSGTRSGLMAVSRVFELGNPAVCGRAQFHLGLGLPPLRPPRGRSGLPHIEVSDRPSLICVLLAIAFRRER